MTRRLPLLDAFAETAKTNPAKLFWICAGVHLLAWTIIPTLTEPNALSDVIEGYAWGHEWPIGTNKHPPMQAWILEVLAIVTGHAPWAHFFASQISVIVAFWAVWQTGRRIVDETGALIGALLLTGVAYYNVVIPEFNPNVLQLPFWALMGFSFHRAVKDDRIIDWLALGLWSAAGLYTKYSSALMLATLGAILLIHPEGRKRLISKGPWLTALTAFVLLLPHLAWLFDHGFVPLTYASDRLVRLPYGAAAFLMAPLLFIVAQALAMLPMGLMWGVSFERGAQPPKRNLRSFDATFLILVTFGPLFLTCGMAGWSGTRMNEMWGTSFWNFAGLTAVFFLRPAFSTAALRRFGCIWTLVFMIGICGFAALDVLRPYVTHKAMRIDFPGRALAEQLTKEWHTRYNTPLRYIVGDMWAAGNVSYYSPDRPHALIVGDSNLTPWITPQLIKGYGDLVKQDGGIVVWCRGSCPTPDTMVMQPYISYFPQAEEQTPLTLPQQTGADVPPSMVGWAILLPGSKSGP